jgi:hypothetical protein
MRRASLRLFTHGLIQPSHILDYACRARHSNLECVCVRRACNGAVVSAIFAIAIVELDARSLIAVCLVGGGVDDVASMCDRESSCP